jgi:hypothetical protein
VLNRPMRVSFDQPVEQATDLAGINVSVLIEEA